MSGEREPSGAREAGSPEGGEKQFDLSGGRLCLDFANTEAERHLPAPRDDLVTYDDLVAWARQAGVLDGDAAAALRRAAHERPDQAGAVLAEARALRGAIYAGFSSLAIQGRMSEPLLGALGDALASLLAKSRLVARDGGFDWAWSGPPDALERPLWAVARSVADLLTSRDLAAVRECASPTCSWLFVDTSRNHSRRWCDMNTCGNREKARRHHQRSKTG